MFKRLILFFLFAFSLTHSAIAKDLVLTVLYDNNPYNEELETRWGFSCLVEGLEKTILFDVGGEGAVLLKNMEKVNIDPKRVDVIMLSHIHYDHIGGLCDFFQKNHDVTVYIPESFPQSIKDKVKEGGAEQVGVHGPTEICRGAYSTGELGSWIKEESLIIKTTKGLVLITGCAHPGIVNIVNKAKEMLHSDVYLVLGGFHLCWMNLSQVKKIISGVREAGVQRAAPCHCSGDLARKQFQKTYGKDFILVGAGKKITLKDAF